jgi:hypothetical protein
LYPIHPLNVILITIVGCRPKNLIRGFYEIEVIGGIYESPRFARFVYGEDV